MRWENLRNYGLVILEDKEVVEIEGCAEYKRALLNFANWGEALTRSMTEFAELMREAIEKKLILDGKVQQKKRIEQHFDEFDNSLTAYVSTKLLFAWWRRCGGGGGLI